MKDRKEYDKKYRETHRNEVSAYMRQYYKRNRDKELARSKLYQKEHRNEMLVYKKLYYEQNKDKILAYQKEHRNERLTYQKQWREQNKDKKRQSTRAWEKNHKEQYREIGRRRNFKRRSLGFVPLNEPFEGSEAHHIDKERVIYIPKEYHQSVSHCLETGKNMALINNLAWDYLLETKIAEAQGGCYDDKA